MPKAPRRCPSAGCTNRITTQRYCDEHTRSWDVASGWRKPSGWATLRESVLERDNWTCHVCGESGADTVDHLVSQANGGTDLPDNLAAIHDKTPPHCHRVKTNRERPRARR